MKSKLLQTAAALSVSLFCLTGTAAAQTPAPSTAAEAVQPGESAQQISTVTLSWHEIPGAVLYELLITDPETGKAAFHRYDIYAAGCQVDTASADLNKLLVWQVRGLNENKVPISDYTEPVPLLQNAIPLGKSSSDVDERGFSRRNYNPYTAAKDDTLKPLKLTTDFGKMAYMPVYPVYSWIPVNNAAGYTIDVFKHGIIGSPDTLVSSYKIKAGVIDYYDEKAYTAPGSYYFKIAAFDSSGNKLAQSVDSYFTVTNDVAVAALGDSITHGGGAVDTPPSSTLYNWETYSSVPVLNIGFSGNLTADMLRRFDSDVLPFAPKLLIIMGGVNDIRTGITAQTTIANLAAIRDKCIAHNIVPVFLTMTSVNPPEMKRVINLDISPGWQAERDKVNAWIKTQDYYVDINDGMIDERGYLPDDMTTDGLHPDYEGKKHIGETAGDYVRLNFSYLLD